MHDMQALRGRLILDYDTFMPLQSQVMQVTAYRSLGDLERGRPATGDDGQKGLVGVYAIDYRFPMLAGPNQPLERAVVVYNLLAGNNYPFTPPDAQIVSRPVPWCVHSAPSGFLCIGEVWEDRDGEMIAAEYALHIAHIFNFDEPDLEEKQHVVDAGAVKFWREVLQSKPLSDVRYPSLPLDVTHGIARETTFRVRTNGPAHQVEALSRAFQPRTGTSGQGAAQAASTPAVFFARRVSP